MTNQEVPLISVITIVRNGEKFIAECLQNVVDQHCDKIEHIIVDGASTDKTVEIIQKFASEHSYVRYISESDQCQSDAMNKGIRMARAKIIGFLNYDDLYEPGVLNRVCEIVVGLNEPTIILGNCRILDGDGNTTSVQREANFSITRVLERGIFPYNPSSYFYHKILHQLVGEYPLDDDYAMDLYFLIRAADAAKIKYFDENWGIFRLHEKSKTYGTNATGESTRLNGKLINEYIAGLSFWRRNYFRARRRIRKMRDFLRIRERINRLFRPMPIN